MRGHARQSPWLSKAVRSHTVWLRQEWTTWRAASPPPHVVWGEATAVRPVGQYKQLDQKALLGDTTVCVAVHAADLVARAHGRRLKGASSARAQRGTKKQKSPLAQERAKEEKRVCGWLPCS